MFILSPDKKTLTDEQGNGYFIQHLNDGEDAITCYANDAVVFEGMEKECLDRMIHLASRLKALEWFEDGPALIGIWFKGANLDTLMRCLDELRFSDNALDALGHIANVLPLHKGCALDVEQFAAEMERKYDTP